MILVNKNFGTPVLSEVIGDMFKGSSNTGMNVDWVPNTGALATGSALVAGQLNIVSSSGDWYNSTGSIPQPIDTASINNFNNYNSTCSNFYIVTEHFLKTLDKVYTKIWNESFTETGIYVPANLATLFHGFAINGELNVSNTDFMIFKKFVDRCITAGILLEEDRLQYEDQIFLSGMSRTDLSTQTDLNNKLITFTASKPIDVKPDLNAMITQYLNGKKLYLMMTPYLTNESIIKGQTETSGLVVTQEPFKQYHAIRHDINQNGSSITWEYDINTPVKRPIAFFKPKTDASKFGRSLPLATHFFWSIGTPEDKAAAELAGTTPPDLIFDHLDRISHIDSLVLKIKFDKLQF